MSRLCLPSGAFNGLRQEHDRADLAYAVVEGVAFGLKDGWAAMQGDGRRAQELALVGGGARSDLWAQLLASALGCGLRRHEGAQAAAAVGAARLAWLADGADEASACTAPAGGRSVRGNAGRRVRGGAGRETALQAARLADVLKVNDEELEMLRLWLGGSESGKVSIKDSARFVLEHVPLRMLLVTCGAAGALAFDGTGRCIAHGHDTRQVRMVDTVGLEDYASWTSGWQGS